MRTAFRSLPVIVLLALALRVGYAWNDRETHSERALSTVPFLFEPGNIAASVAAGKGFSSPLRVESGPTAWMTPLYPLLLAGVFRVFGAYTFHAWEAAVALNILFGVLTCIPIFLTGRRVGGADAGALAAWLWALFPNALILPAESIWDASLAALLGACILFFTLRVAASRRWRAWAAYGALWGVALMTSATLGLALPFLLGWMVWRTRALLLPGVAAGMIVLCCAPWTVRNFVAMHAFVPLRSVGGVSLWMGTIDPELGRWPGSFHPLADSRERARFLEMGEIAYMREKEQVALAFIAAHPGTELRLSAQRFVALWAGGAMHPLSAFVRNGSLWFRVVLLFNLAAALMGLVGIVRLLQRRNPNGFPVAIVAIVVPCAFYLTLASARYRLVVDPAVMVLASVGAVGCAPRSRSAPASLRVR